MEGDMCGECSGTPQASIKTIDRRRFLMLGGLAFAGMELALGSDPGMAQTSSGVSLAKEFEAASKRYGVPEELLLAMGYVNTLWEMPPPGASGGDSPANKPQKLLTAHCPERRLRRP